MSEGPIYGDLAEADWCIIEAGTNLLTCKRCGSTEEAPMGLLLQQFADILQGFVRRHAHCEP